MKKSILVSILALTMSASILAGCGSKAETAQPEEPQTEAQTEETTTKEAEPVSTGYPAATLTADTYSNEAINLKMTVPSDWTLYTEQQLADYYNGSLTEPGAGDTFYEAFAQRTSGGDNVSIIVQDASGQKDLIKSMGIKVFTEMASDGIQEALEGAGATDINFGLIDIDFPLDDFACINSTCSLQGMSIVQKQIVFLVGDYLYTITVTAFDEAGANAVLGFFSKIK